MRPLWKWLPAGLCAASILGLAGCEKSSSDKEAPATNANKAPDTEETDAKSGESQAVSEPPLKMKQSSEAPPTPVRQSPQTREAARRAAMEQMLQQRNPVTRQ